MITPKDGRFYIDGTDKWFGTRAKAETYCDRMGLKPAPAKVASRPIPERVHVAPKAAPKATPVEKPARYEYPILGGGLIQTTESSGSDGTRERPFVVVEVSPSKNRAFYMSTGTGGQTSSGEWNAFGGISGGGQMGLGWFIKPTEGKRVDRYAAVSKFLTNEVGANAKEAWHSIRDTVRGARTFDGRYPAGFVAVYEKAQEAVHRALQGGDPLALTKADAIVKQLREERRGIQKRMGAALNGYLGGLGAIETFGGEDDDVHQIKRRKAGGDHLTFHASPRVAFNPRR